MPVNYNNLEQIKTQKNSKVFVCHCVFSIRLSSFYRIDYRTAIWKKGNKYFYEETKNKIRRLNKMP